MGALRILVVAETRVYRDLLADALRRLPDVVVVEPAGDAAAARDRIANDHPQIALVDTGGARGTHALRLIASSQPNVPVIALAVPESEGEIVRLAEAGVAGYVTRDASLDELVEIIRGVLRGEAMCSPRMASTLLRRIAELSAARRYELPGAQPNLTSRELEIVNLIAEGLSNKEIASRLYIELPTVKNHVHNILLKLHVHRRNDAVASVRASPDPRD